MGKLLPGQPSPSPKPPQRAGQALALRRRFAKDAQWCSLMPENR
jgi:hypothetical protein